MFFLFFKLYEWYQISQNITIIKGYYIMLTLWSAIREILYIPIQISFNSEYQLIVCSYHVTYAFQSESKLYIAW